MEREKPVILTIAGFDPSAGAGVSADIKTIAAHGLYGVACITALTVQTTQGVFGVEHVESKIVRQTLETLFTDTPPAATKIGMLGSADVARTLSEFLKTNPQPHVVLDPVLRSTSGTALLDAEGIEVLKRDLLGLAEVVTPNLDEAGFLSGMRVRDEGSMQAAARKLHELGAKNVVVKGGHLPSPADLLSQLRPNGGFVTTKFAGEKVETTNTHGTGCAFSTALACNLGLGLDLVEAVRRAKEFVGCALRYSYPVGKGTGPVNHLFRFKSE